MALWYGNLVRLLENTHSLLKDVDSQLRTYIGMSGYELLPEEQKELTQIKTAVLTAMSALSNIKKQYLQLQAKIASRIEGEKETSTNQRTDRWTTQKRKNDGK